MKKSVIIGKRQFILAGLVVVLGVAVWLNMTLAANGGGLDISAELTSSKYLGEAQLVNNPSAEGADTDSSDTASDDALETAAGNDNIISKTKKERESARQDEIDLLEENINSAKTKGADATTALERISVLTKRTSDEKAIEGILEAKGYTSAVTIGDSDVTVMVESGELLSNQTMQLKDAVQSTVDVKAENIKIITIK